MPIYEYECAGCGQIEEAFQKISEAPLETCRHCKGKLNKLISQSSFHLKGSGWYVTDYGGTSAKGKKTTQSKEGAAKKCNASCSKSSCATSSEDK